VCSTCYAHRVVQHVAKCPAAKRRAAVEGMPFFSRNINLPSSATEALGVSAAPAPAPAARGAHPPKEGGLGEPKEEKEEREGEQEPQQKKRKRQQAPSLFASMGADQLESLVAIVRAAHARHCREPLETVMLRHPPCEAHFTPAKGYVCSFCSSPPAGSRMNGPSLPSPPPDTVRLVCFCRACSVKHMTQQRCVGGLHTARVKLLAIGDGMNIYKIGVGVFCWYASPQSDVPTCGARQLYSGAHGSGGAVDRRSLLR
jgi:hypothetical protein